MRAIEILFLTAEIGAGYRIGILKCRRRPHRFAKRAVRYLKCRIMIVARVKPAAVSSPIVSDGRRVDVHRAFRQIKSIFKMADDLRAAEADRPAMHRELNARGEIRCHDDFILSK